MPDTELAEELLQIEEADAWFEYLESTRGQGDGALPGARAVGVGPADPAPAGRPCPPRAPAARRSLSSRRVAPPDDASDGAHGPLIALRPGSWPTDFDIRRSARRSAAGGRAPARAYTRRH